MKKLLSIIALSLLLLTACSLFQGPPGSNGLPGSNGVDGSIGPDGGYLVGGFLDITLVNLPGSNPALPTPVAGATLFIAFDLDNLLSSGNETIINFPLENHIIAGEVYYYGSWSTSTVSPGDYYVYAWYSEDNDPTIDELKDAELYYLYMNNANGSQPELSLDRINYKIDPGSSGILQPNFTVDPSYTPELNISINENNA